MVGSKNDQDLNVSVIRVVPGCDTPEDGTSIPDLYDGHYRMERIVWYRHPPPPECPDNQEHDFPGPNDGAEVEPHDVAHVVRSACRNCGLRRTIDFWDNKTKRYAPAGLCSYEVSTKDPGQYGEMLREMNRRLKDKA